MTITQPRARPGRPPKVSRTSVVDAAVALAEAEGLDAVSIRGVAARLGVAPMTLYGHVAGAEELIDLVVGASITAAVHEMPDSLGDAREVVRAFAGGLREMLLEHPAVLDAYRRRPVQDRTGVAVADVVISALIADGVDDDVAVAVYATVYAFVIGFVSLESRPGQLDPAALQGHPRLEGMDSRLVDLFDQTTFDHGIAALIDSAVPDPDR